MKNQYQLVGYSTSSNDGLCTCDCCCV